MTSHVHAERRIDCPFSIALEYAAQFLRRFETLPMESVVRMPLAIFGLTLPGALQHRVRLRVSIHPDPTDKGRQHEAIHVSWWSESKWLPNLSGTLCFRIASHVGTLLLFDGTYTQPFGFAGAIFDQLLGRHVAAATVRDLLDRIGDELASDEREFRASHVPDTQEMPT